MRNDECGMMNEGLSPFSSHLSPLSRLSSLQTKMGNPQISIQVNDKTGVWSVDGMPMILVPRHFFVNNHVAIEAALGKRRYARELFVAGHRSAYVWCQQEALTHGILGIEIFHHYMKRLSQRGWGQFHVERIDAEGGRAVIRVEHSVFVLERQEGRRRKVCYMFSGWFCGALEFLAEGLGVKLKASARETQCAAEGDHAHCVFHVTPKA